MRTIAIVIAAALASIAVAAVCLMAPGYYAYLLGMLATTALAGIGLNVLLGLAGEVSLGQSGFVALGAYGVGILTTKAGLNFWEALPLAVFVVAAISAALSIPALRVTGPYLAMVTIAFGFIVESVSIEWRDLTGGSSGLAGIPPPFGTGGTALLACASVCGGACAVSLSRTKPHWSGDAGLCLGAGRGARRRDQSGTGTHGRLCAGRRRSRSCRRLAGRADRLHRAKLVPVFAIDPVSSGGRRRRRRPHAWAADRIGSGRVAAGTAGGS